MRSALVIGGSGFVGRHTVQTLLKNGYELTWKSRSEPTVPLPDRSAVKHVPGDRTDRSVIEGIAEWASPDVVIDCAAFHPEDVAVATEVVADVDAYVYVSSGGVYRVQEIPNREDGPPLHEFSADHASDRSMATYGPPEGGGRSGGYAGGVIWRSGDECPADLGLRAPDDPPRATEPGSELTGVCRRGPPRHFYPS